MEKITPKLLFVVLVSGLIYHLIVGPLVTDLTERLWKTLPKG